MQIDKKLILSFILFDSISFALKSLQKHTSNVSFITREAENPPSVISREPRREYANKPYVFFTFSAARKQKMLVILILRVIGL